MVAGVPAGVAMVGVPPQAEVVTSAVTTRAMEREASVRTWGMEPMRPRAGSLAGFGLVTRHDHERAVHVVDR